MLQPPWQFPFTACYDVFQACPADFIDSTVKNLETSCHQVRLVMFVTG